MSRQDVEAFDKVWEGAMDRFMTQEPLCNYLRSNLDHLDLCSAKTMLSIGPGIGTMDVEIINTCMPNLQSYTAVDPCVKMLHHVKENCGNLEGKIKIDLVHSKLQEYKGPANKVDVILMSHMLYYMPDTVHDELRKILQWVNPNGVVIIAISRGDTGKGSNCIADVRSAVGFATPGLDFNSVTVAKALKDIGVEFTEDEIPWAVSIHPGQGLEEMVHICIHQPPTPSEMERVISTMRKYCDEGSDEFDMGQNVFIIKQQK